METALSHHGVPIRLTPERCMHIVENHDDLAGMMYEVLEVVAKPDVIIDGDRDECIAIQARDPLALVVVYGKRNNRKNAWRNTFFFPHATSVCMV